jgi:hypothetical protein
VKLARTPEEMAAWLPPAEAGVDIFHCSQRRFWQPEFEGSDLNFAGGPGPSWRPFVVRAGSGLYTTILHGVETSATEAASVNTGRPRRLHKG